MEQKLKTGRAEKNCLQAAKLDAKQVDEAVGDAPTNIKSVVGEIRTSAPNVNVAIEHDDIVDTGTNVEQVGTPVDETIMILCIGCKTPKPSAAFPPTQLRRYQAKAWCSECAQPTDQENAQRQLELVADHGGHKPANANDGHISWTCSQCTFENVQEDTMCSMCRGERPGSGWRKSRRGVKR